MKKTLCILILLIIALFICSCQKVDTSLEEEKPKEKDEDVSSESKDKLKKYTNIAWEYNGANNLIFEEGEYSEEDIATYSFNETIIFKGSEKKASAILEAGKNPGLGISDLHKKGITGKGVNVGIIDQDMLIDNPEIKDKIAAYYDTGCEQLEDRGSMHGIAVTSIFAGNTVGVAPDVKIYYAAAPSWKKDAKYFADGLNWIIEQNKDLPEGEKIRVVSISGAPQSENNWFANGDDWIKAVEAANADGIMVIDCRSGYETGFIFSAYYDADDPENVEKCRIGYPGDHRKYNQDMWSGYIFAPASLRTLGEGYKLGEYNYRYDGVGGQSWSVPYVGGVLALGWQIRPDIDYKTMKELLFSSAYVNSDGNHIINPPKFIEAVKNAE